MAHERCDCHACTQYRAATNQFYQIGKDLKNFEKASVPELKSEEIMKPLSIFEDFSEEEILFYSTPHFEELQAAKEHQEKLKKEELNNGN